MQKKILTILLSLFFLAGGLAAEEKSKFKFEIVKSAEATSVKNQSKTGTCWAFATSSFLESELLRMGKGQYDLSEMYVVRMIYPEKIKNYVRLHGKTQFGPGSVSGDMMRVVREHGLVPDTVFTGRHVGQSKHDHQEMDAVLKASLDALIENKSRMLSKAWPEALNGVLNAYLGEIPENFAYKGKAYTPRSFADSLEIQADDYVEFTSFTHHPYYEKFSLEVPDNWHRNTSYNVPLEEFMSIVDSAIDQGYTLTWDGDVSEPSFHREREVAILPKKDWDDRTKEEQAKICLAPEPELVVTQDLRQDYFDNYSTNDDHLMHLTGLAKDQNGTRYYIIKNSWGTLDRANKGYVYVSEPYFRAKTISVMVHRDAVPEEVATKLKSYNP